MLTSRNLPPIQQVMFSCPSVLYSDRETNGEWEEYTFASPVPLRLEDIQIKGPYRYPLLCGTYSDLLIIVAQTRKIIDYFRNGELARSVRPAIRSRDVNVDKLVREVVKKPTDYGLNFVHAQVPGFGSTLNAISFYGEDLGEASFFRENLKLLDSSTCGLHQVGDSREVSRVGSDGLVSFTYTGSDSILLLLDLLDYINFNKCF